MNILKRFWSFFSSVKLAIFTLCSLALTSIIGTVIPQGQSPNFYLDRFGEQAARFMYLLDIPEMYSSWWFISLLVLLAINLIVCSLQRIPGVWRLIQADNLGIQPERISKMKVHHTVVRSSPLKKEQILSVFKTQKTVPQMVARQDGQLYFAQKGKYSRLGVYIVHLSILVIFAGAIVGAMFGEKGHVMIPELQTVRGFFSAKDKKAMDFGFDLRCDRFLVDFYNNGMPKKYQSTLTIREKNRDLFTKTIEVNHPLTYKGYTLYQASYQGFQDFIIEITDSHSKKSYLDILPYQKEIFWQENNCRFGIVAVRKKGPRDFRVKLWLKPAEKPASQIWLAPGETRQIAHGSGSYSVQVRQLYATGIQVAKDPGVWIVYLGCGLMLLGLYMVFFHAHQRIWLFQSAKDAETILVLGGNTNKKRERFQETLARMQQQLENHP